MPTGKSLELHPLYHGAVRLWSKALTVPGGWDCHSPNSMLRERPEKRRRFPRGCVLTKGSTPALEAPVLCTHRTALRFSPYRLESIKEGGKKSVLENAD